MAGGPRVHMAVRDIIYLHCLCIGYGIAFFYIGTKQIMGDEKACIMSKIKWDLPASYELEIPPLGRRQVNSFLFLLSSARGTITRSE